MFYLGRTSDRNKIKTDIFQTSLNAGRKLVRRPFYRFVIDTQVPAILSYGIALCTVGIYKNMYEKSYRIQIVTILVICTVFNFGTRLPKRNDFNRKFDHTCRYEMTSRIFQVRHLFIFLNNPSYPNSQTGDGFRVNENACEMYFSIFHSIFS